MTTGHRVSRRSLLVGAPSLLLAGASAGRADNFPSGPVKIVSTVGPGAAPDLVARLVAEYLTRRWGQQVLVLNQPGGAGAVAIKSVSQAVPDGHTLYMAVASNFIALPELQVNFPVDVLRDFVPIGFIGEQPLIIGAAPKLEVNTLPELIALLKRRPGELNIAAGNRGSILHLAGEWLRAATGTQFTLLFYAGGSMAVPDVMGGRVQVMIDAIASMRGAIEGGVKPIAVTSPGRLENYPGVAAGAETLPGYQAMGWMALMAPHGTPLPIARKISDDLRELLLTPELKARMVEFGTYVKPTTPEELTAYIVEQQRIWRPVIAETVKTMK